MLNIQEVVNIINDKLNEINLKLGFKYKIKVLAEIGMKPKEFDLVGVMTTTSAPTEPIEESVDINYNYAIEFVVPAIMSSNFNTIQFKKIVGEAVKEFNGKVINFSNGKGILTMSEAVPKQHGIDGDVGMHLNLQVNVSIQYTENNILSGEKHWLLNDSEIKYMSESILIEKDGRINKIQDSDFTQTLITGQTKYYNFEIPYNTQNEVCTTLQRDMLVGDLDKRYKLTYYDGVSFTKENPFSTTVSIFRNANSKSSKPKASFFNITFTDVDDGSANVKYYLALCDSIFDNNSVNTRFFEPTEDKTAQQVQLEYWESKISCSYERIEAPNLNSIDITSQVYSNSNNYELFDLVNKNYAILKVENNGVPIKYFYYFVQNASIGSQKQVMFDLKLDTIQTYLFDDKIEFSDCFINRAHINRWIDNGDGTVSFDGEINSPLFLNEEIGDSPKQLQTMHTLKWKYTPKEDLNGWLNKYVAYWVYAFIDLSHDYTLFTESGNKRENANGSYWQSATKDLSGNEVYNQYAIICYPIFKKTYPNPPNAKIQLKILTTGKIYECDYTSMNDFKQNNKDSSYIFSQKISLMPPFRNLSNYNIDNKTLTINIQGSGDVINSVINDGTQQVRAMYTNIDNFLFGGVSQSAIPLESESITIDYDFKLNKIEVKGLTNKKFNPKLLNNNNLIIRLKSFENASFDYDLQKINNNTFSFLYSETLQPEITKYYCRLKAPQGLYVEDTNKNFMGIVGSTDTTIAISNDQYQAFLANNKNFWLQSTFQIGGNLVSDIGRSAVAGSTTGIIGGVISGVGNTASSLIDKAMTIDNMKESPDSLKNSGGNMLFSSQIKEISMFVEVHIAIDSVLKNRNDHNVLYGFIYNSIGNIKSYLNIRKYYNYVKAEIDSIRGIELSNNARLDIKQRFREGIRFWNSDEIQYNLENYEKWLEY